MTAAETSEEHSQKDYEGFMQDSAGKRARAVKDVGIKSAAKADNEIAKTTHDGDHKEASKQLMATKAYE